MMVITGNWRMTTPWRLAAATWLLLTLVTWSVSLAADETSIRVFSSPARVWLVQLAPHVTSNGLPTWEESSSAAARAQRREQVAAFLEASALPTQLRVEELIRARVAALDGAIASSRGVVQVEKLWITNTLIVRLVQDDPASNSAYPALLDALLMNQLLWVPGVVSVERDGATGLSLIQPTAEDQSLEDIDQDNSGDPQKNIRLVHAPELWAQAKLQGKGVTVASIDSGVRYTHETLAKTFRGYSPAHPKNVSYDYSFWFPTGTDISKETPDTADQVGHGTHTVGTAVGSLGVGVAPQATWIAARAFDIQGAVSKSDFLLATQWVICPTKVDGSAKNCSLGADIITGSFGVDRTDVETYKQWTWLTHIIQVWRAAGSYAVFASGNTNGFKCGSVYYPANREESLAVGALIGGSTLWGASGKGPSIEDGEGLVATTVLKPDFVAPGAAIRSALSTTDTAYTRLTGTSMATPHVAGLLALLLSGVPHTSTGKTPDLVKALQSTASHALSKPFLVPSACGGIKYDTYPNNIYGYGLPDVCQAAATALGVKCHSSTALQNTTSEYIAVE